MYTMYNTVTSINKTSCIVQTCNNHNNEGTTSTIPNYHPNKAYRHVDAFDKYTHNTIRYVKDSCCFLVIGGLDVGFASK